MIVCTNCGFRNAEGDTFCGGCQEFLEWTGEAVDGADDDEVEEVDPAPGEPANRGVVDRVIDAIRNEDDDRAPAAETTIAPETGGGSLPSGSAAADAVARAEREAAEAEAQRVEAQARADAHMGEAARARRAAVEAEKARREAEQQAAQEAEEAERVRARLEEARAARETAEAELQAESEAAAKLREEAEQARADVQQARADEAELAGEREAAAAARARLERELAETLAAERAAVEAAQAELERVEAARRDAEERARQQAEAAIAAEEAADTADRERRAAEERARQQSEEAARARRAAALVASPKSTVARKDEPDRDLAEAVTPTPVKPSKPKPRPRPESQAGEPTRKRRPGDLICGECGEGNAPTRNFCRRCGETLAEAEVVRTPWWRRLVPGGTPKVHEAGTRRRRDRPRRSPLRMLRKLMARLVMLTILLGALGIAFLPNVRSEVVDRGRSLFDRGQEVIAPEYVPVTPVDARASSELPGNPAINAIDNTNNRWWAENVDGPGIGETIEVFFSQPTDIGAIGITAGAADPELFTLNPRPRTLRVIFDTGQIEDITLQDEADFQSFEIRAPNVTSALFRIVDVYIGQGGEDTAITTLEFRALE